jgi:hypothetical protein
MYTESDDGSGAITTRNYAVLRPEQETRAYTLGELLPTQIHEFGDLYHRYGSTYRALNDNPRMS